MAIEHIGRLIIQNDTQANVEAVLGNLAEIVFGRDTGTGAIGYSIDAGVTWTWIVSSLVFSDAEGDPIDVDASAAADGTSNFAARRDHRHRLGVDINLKYTQFLTVVSGGDFTFVIDADGNPITGQFDLE